jgi:hypothetical protein
VGLWHLDVMQPSYDKVGMNQPNVHPACTMHRYGGIQAVMALQSSRAVQTLFLSSYMLSFEAIRR